MSLGRPALVTRATGEARPSSRRLSRVVGLGLGAAGIALLAAGTGWGVVAASRASGLMEGCTTATPCTTPQLEQRDRDLASARVTAIVLWATGGAAAVAGALLLLLPSRPSAEPGLTAWLGPTSLGVTWRRGF